jgi:predicted naringenin-chalcone synthase
MLHAWRQRELRDGLKINYVELDLPVEDADLIVKKYVEQITPRTKIVHITHIMNWNGQVIPAKRIADEAHKRGIEVLIDGAHSFAHLEYKIPDLGGDYYGTSLHNWLSAPINQKMIWYRKQAVELALAAANKTINNAGISKEEIGAIVSVSCTGLYAPGLEIDLINALGLRQDVKRFPVNFVGCYAMFTALELASNCANQLDSATPYVLVVGVELCSLHYSPTYTPDAALAHALFADGAASGLVSKVKPNNFLGLEMLSHKATLIPAEHDMAWHLGPSHFQMQLSAYVPSLLAPVLSKVLPSPDVAELYEFAIHPGGRKILEEVMAALEIEHEELSPSYDVMENYGNMRSVTILFVLEKLIHKPSKISGKIIAAGFGPGLSLMLMNLRRVQ